MREWIADLISDHIEIIVVGICVLLVIACLWTAAYEDSAWKEYAKQHHCVARGIKKGQMVMNGNGSMGTTQDQTVFVCDDQEIVIR